MGFSDKMAGEVVQNQKGEDRQNHRLAAGKRSAYGFFRVSRCWRRDAGGFELYFQPLQSVEAK